MNSSKNQTPLEELTAPLDSQYTEGKIREIIKNFLDTKKVKIDHIHLEHPEDATHGDYATNIAFKLAGMLKTSPQTIGEEMAEKLSQDAFFEKVEFAAPGFVNFFLSKKVKIELITEINNKKTQFGASDIGKNSKLQIEFISANPTGPLTFPNARGGFTGDVLARVYTLIGLSITKEYYINDYGNQVNKLGKSVEAEYKALKGEEVEYPEDGYKGEYIKEIAKQLFDENQNLSFEEITEKSLEINIESAKETTEKMGIVFDNWFHEKELHESGKVDKALEELKSLGKIYEKDGAVWLKTTDFGDDKDRVVVKSDGEKTYIMADIAYHLNKFIERKFDIVINIWGADHHGDIKRLRAGIDFLGVDEKKLEIPLASMMKMTKNGEEFKISKRAGTYVLMNDVLEQVPVDVLRYFSLMYDLNSPMTLDLDLALDTSEKNPVYYVEYAHARMASIIRKADQDFANANLDLLTNEELEIVTLLMEFPEIVHLVARSKEVHHLPHYALKLAKAFHKFYHDFQVISDDQELTKARLALVSAVKTTLKNTLALIGISAPEKM